MVGQDLKNLDSRRRELRMSRFALAKRAGLSLPTLNRIFEGQANPTVETLFALAGALGVEFRIANNGIEPRETSTASEFRQSVAEKKAQQLVKIVQGTSALEAQAVAKSDEEDMIRQTVQQLLTGPSRRLWAS
jgi:transcriptional regulator with XRE-family HTH domain